MDTYLLERTAQAGSPLISPDIIFFYFFIFFFSVGLIYLIYHFIRKPENPNHFKSFFLLSIAAKAVVVITAIVIAAYYFLPTPKVVESTPGFYAQEVPVRSKIEIKFDRPVDRGSLSKKITPQVPGIWNFEVGFYKTHLYRKLVFYPDQTLLPGTVYEIELNNVKNASNISSSRNYSFTFKTEPIPAVVSTQPLNNAEDISIDSNILIDLDRPNNYLADFSFVIEPTFDYSLNLSPDRNYYSITPKEALKHGTTYKVTVIKMPASYNLKNEVINRGNEVNEYQFTFRTKNPPQIANFSPNGDNVLVNSKVNIDFSKAMVRQTVEENFSTDPPTKGTFHWQGDKKMVYSPYRLKYDTNYSLIVGGGSASRDGSLVENNIALEFRTIGPVKLISAVSSNPQNSNQGIGVDNNLRFNFNQPVDNLSAQDHFSINPPIEGDFFWEENILVFNPHSQLGFDTSYTVSFQPGIISIHGLDSNEEFTVKIATESFVFKLTVPAYLQKYTLSCEVASLNMILAFKGIKTDEDTLLNLVGFDNTPKKDGIWGDPNIAFVGNVRGKQMVSGYGVHWAPIERVAKTYRSAQAFSNWSLSQITDQLLKGNPIQVWLYAGSGVPIQWQTPSGNQVFANSTEHTVVVIGFVGKKEDPSQIIVNDPLLGEVYLPQLAFNNKWNSFGRSGVVIF